MPKKVNEQITDSVTQTNTQVLAGSPANAMGNLFTSMGLAMSNLNNNATSAQQQANIGMQAATVQGVNALTAIGTAVLGRATEAIVKKTKNKPLANVTLLLKVPVDPMANSVNDIGLFFRSEP